jgi:hypothetical protein
MTWEGVELAAAATPTTTPLTGSLDIVNKDDPSQGDGDESDYYYSVSGPITLTLTVNRAGVVTGTSTATISDSGFTNDDTDGDNDAFSNNGSGTATVSGTTSKITSTIYLSDGTGGVVLSGHLNSTDTQFTGTAQV